MNENKDIASNKKERIFFIGIGGIGMSALARYFNEQGAIVSGYDKTQTPLTSKLQEEGISIHFEDSIELLDTKANLVVYTPAIPKDHKQLNFYIENSYEIKKRSEVLGLISKNMFTIAVAGSHGKTTVSGMIAHVCYQLGVECTAFLGGILSNYNSNYLYNGNQSCIVEADEFDRSFLHLSPTVAVITSIDTDHLDVYGSYENVEKEFKAFVDLIKEGGVLITKPEYAHLHKGRTVTYSLDDKDADYYISEMSVFDGRYLFSVRAKGMNIPDLSIGMGGKHNIENALAAVAACFECGIKEPYDLASFQGIKRRFEKHIEKENVVYIDDYAHHPSEIKALLSSVREMHENWKITAIFQPHLYSRTQDLAIDFGKQLSVADEVILLPIYPARELPIEGVSSELILNNVDTNTIILDKESVVDYIKDSKGVILTIGAGNISQIVNPIKEVLGEI